MQNVMDRKPHLCVDSKYLWQCSRVQCANTWKNTLKIYKLNISLPLPLFCPFFCLLFVSDDWMPACWKINRRTACKKHWSFRMSDYNTLELPRTSNEIELKIVFNIHSERLAPTFLWWKKMRDVNIDES